MYEVNGVIVKLFVLKTIKMKKSKNEFLSFLDFIMVRKGYESINLFIRFQSLLLQLYSSEYLQLLQHLHRTQDLLCNS